MTDLHTHILPGMDDGAENVEESLALLRRERQQGVDTVVLTPHFYRTKERPKWFLERRAKAANVLAKKILALPEEEWQTLPRMLLGAEVAWVPNMADWEELPDLCLGNGRYLLLELPFSRWNDQMFHQIYDLMGRTGITPVIAHLERYRKIQPAESIDTVLSLGLPVQLSADALLQPMFRTWELRQLRTGQAQILASDCHSLSSRPPNLGAAIKTVRNKLGSDVAEKMIRSTDKIAGL